MSTSIAKVQTNDRQLNQIQDNVMLSLNPLLKNALLSGALIQEVSLASGTNTISHNLGRELQGWFVVRIRASATIYDTQDKNTIPSLTLVLVASAPVVVDLYCF